MGQGLKNYGWIIILFLICSGKSKSFVQLDENITLPFNLADSLISPERNPITEAGVALGRMLFYDPILSGSNQVSCATCHQQEKSFSDGLDVTNQGDSKKLLIRHVPALINLAWYPNGYFWDGGATDLESLAFGPITNEDEMDQDLNELVMELSNSEIYPEKFKAAFQTDSIYSALIGRALAQFQRTLISGNSRYDYFVRGEAGGELSEQELSGLELFASKCGSCHTFGQGNHDFFTDFQYHNNGIDKEFWGALEGVFLGRFRITQDTLDIGKFKTPTLRNIVLTAPYMHDGRFKTLEEVLDHYSENLKYSTTLDLLLIQPDGKIGISLEPKEKEAIIAFLQTLTDQEFVENKDFANPFLENN